MNRVPPDLVNKYWMSVDPAALSDCVRHTLVIFHIVDNFSTLTHSSFFKCNSRFPPDIRDVALSSGLKKIRYMNIFMNIRRIHHFQQASEFVFLIPFKYNGKIFILTFTARRRARRQKKHVRKDFRQFYEFASRDTKELVFDLSICG